ncbi:MAG: hypothetical protein FWF98_01840 [Dehalococcoidia bacterium]|nr:hypothetical protein [Dehalococcoidia bacterium]
MRRNRATYNPILTDFVLSTAIYIGAPVLLFLTKAIEINVNRIFIFCVFIVLYIVFIFTRFTSGIRAILDLITDKVVTEKLTYCSTFQAESGIGVLNRSKETRTETTRVNESYVLRIIFANNKGKRFFTTVFLHNMEQGKSYDVTYGKFSKILLSVVDKNGKELLQGDE